MQQEFALQRPVTPQAGAFQPGHATLQLLDSVREQFREIYELRHALDRTAAEADELCRENRLRTLGAHTNMRRLEYGPDAMAILETEHAQLAADHRRAVDVVVRVARSLSLICAAFRHVPPIPMNDRALVEMLDLVQRLQILYGTVQEGFEQAHRALDPIREELQAIQAEQRRILDRLDRMTDEPSLPPPAVNAESGASIQAIHSAVLELRERINALEQQQHPREAAREYLEGLGLDSDALRRIAHSSIAQRPQYPPPTWSWGSTTA